MSNSNLNNLTMNNQPCVMGLYVGVNVPFGTAVTVCVDEHGNVWVSNPVPTQLQEAAVSTTNVAEANTTTEIVPANDVENTNEPSEEDIEQHEIEEDIHDLNRDHCVAICKLEESLKKCLIELRGLYDKQKLDYEKIKEMRNFAKATKKSGEAYFDPNYNQTELDMVNDQKGWLDEYNHRFWPKYIVMTTDYDATFDLDKFMEVIYPGDEKIAKALSEIQLEKGETSKFLKLFSQCEADFGFNIKKFEDKISRKKEKEHTLSEHVEEKLEKESTANTTTTNPSDGEKKQGRWRKNRRSYANVVKAKVNSGNN